MIIIRKYVNIKLVNFITYYSSTRGGNPKWPLILLQKVINNVVDMCKSSRSFNNKRNAFWNRLKISSGIAMLSWIIVVFKTYKMIWLTTLICSS